MMISMWLVGVLVLLIVALFFLWVRAVIKWQDVAHDLQLLGTRPLTAKELATQKRVSVSTVARLARAGKIKAEKVGRQWRISQGEE